MVEGEGGGGGLKGPHHEILREGAHFSYTTKTKSTVGWPSVLVICMMNHRLMFVEQSQRCPPVIHTNKPRLLQEPGLMLECKLGI